MMHLHFPTEKAHALTHCRGCGERIDPFGWVAFHNPSLIEVPLYFHTVCAGEFLFKASLGAQFMGMREIRDELIELHHSYTLYMMSGAATETKRNDR